MTKHFCDKCGNDITGMNGSKRVIITVDPSNTPAKELILCKKCTEDLILSLKVK